MKCAMCLRHIFIDIFLMIIHFAQQDVIPGGAKGNLLRGITY